MPLRFQPGTAYMYSLATDVCGALVEHLSGVPFAEYLQRHILGPLGMADTSFQVAADKLPRFAANYARKPDKTTTLLDDPATSSFTRPPAFVSGGGGLTGTVADYIRFCEMLRRGGELDGRRIIGPRTLDLMRMNHLPGGKDLAALDVDLLTLYGNVGVGFGLGFASTIDQVATGAGSRRLLLGWRRLHRVLGGPDRGPVGGVHDPVDAVGLVRLPRPAAQPRLQRHRRLSPLKFQPPDGVKLIPSAAWR